MKGSTVRAIALYLPQYHPIPENDVWYGKGFTEWTNVAKARPLFRDHYQPHLPADLGFYDLRVPEMRQAQADLAREHGIHGFCYYHYWFSGKRLLERPFNEVLALGKPDFPFCLCWANEHWKRPDDDFEREILVEQRYSEDDDLRHILRLIPAFSDPRYIRIDGKPLFLVYRAARLPNAEKTASLWRQEAGKAGLPGLFLCRVENYKDESGDPAHLGFDAAVEFQPHWADLTKVTWKRYYWRLLRMLRLPPPAYRTILYDAVVEAALARPAPPYLRFPCVTPSWDNCARRKRGGLILTGATPGEYGAWLKTVAERLQACDPARRVVFINAWNEWAEGCHLEPCRKWGRAYLEATRRALGPS